jgi:hypothetical protein
MRNACSALSKGGQDGAVGSDGVWGGDSKEYPERRSTVATGPREARAAGGDSRRARPRGGALAAAGRAGGGSPAARVRLVPRVRREALRLQPPARAGEAAGRSSARGAAVAVRVATAATEGAWWEAARGKSVRELEELVSGQKPGNLPGDLPDEGARRHVLRLEVSGEVLATFREAMATVRREAGEALDDDAAVLLLCRQALGGPRDDGRSSYQVALTVCEQCRRGMQQGRGELVEVPRQIVEMAACDAQDVGHVDRAHVGAKRATQAVAPALRRQVTRRDGGRCRAPGCRHAVFTDVHHLRLRSEGGESTLANLVTLCSAHHRAIHRGELVVDGEADGLDFRHADGTPYGEPPSAVGTELRARAYRALTAMGYRETEAKSALAQVPGSARGSLEQLVRRALLELAPTFSERRRWA